MRRGLIGVHVEAADRASDAVIPWWEFARVAPDLAAAGQRLLERNEVAFLATVSADGRPRLHPFVPKTVQGRLVAFVTDASPKIRDLRAGRPVVVHALPGAEDEEFCVGGRARELEPSTPLRALAASAMGFATGVDEHHVLFEFLLDRALHTRWLGFGTPEHRPSRSSWRSRA